MGEKGKSADGLMRHIRDKHNVDINGSVEKQDLLNMGYYHGYKASRYIRDKNNVQNYTDFETIKAIYDFDISVKTVFYSMLIKIETSIKNRLCDYLVSGEEVDIEYVYNQKLNDYKSKSIGSKDYKKYLNKKLELRNKIDSSIAYNYSKGHPCIQHFFHSSKPLPVWAFFEVITLGELGNFVSCMNFDYRKEFTEKISLHHSGTNQNARMLENIIFCLTSLRNATMHNSMIFDCRFNNSNFSNQLKQYLSAMTNVKDIDFNSLVDFLVLLVFLMKKQKTTKIELKKIIRDFDSYRETLFSKIPKNAYDQIIGTNARIKISSLRTFVDR